MAMIIIAIIIMSCAVYRDMSTPCLAHVVVMHASGVHLSDGLVIMGISGLCIFVT